MAQARGGIDPAISIAIFPDGPVPVTVPAGSSFTYIGQLANNNTSDSAYTQVWVKVRKPDQTYSDTLDYWPHAKLGSGETKQYDWCEQYVYSGADIGLYNYIAYCGDLITSAIIDSCYFEVDVISPTAYFSGLGWKCFGWGDERKPDNDMPFSFMLKNNYPNPFNASTNISFDLPSSGEINLSIYNLLGQRVETLVDEVMEPGHYIITWDASVYSSGIYFYQLTAGSKIITKRMTLVK